MGNSATNPALDNASNSIEDLRSKLITSTGKKQLEVVDELVASPEGLTVLKEFLLAQKAELNPFEAVQKLTLAGKIYQLLYQVDQPEQVAFLEANFPEGIIPLKSDAGVDYLPLQKLLAKQDFLNADKLTLQKLCELAGSTAVQRKWVYFTEVKSFPATDLQTINSLWIAHSSGRFGFSVQRELWLSFGKNWEKLWSKIGWKEGNLWTRYPDGFTWTINAPQGHLPLSNQLRGVRVIEALLEHPAWKSESIQT